MAVDESTTIKTPTAKRTKAILSLGNLQSIEEYSQVHPLLNHR